MNFDFRQAEMKDAKFISKVIIEADKSGSEINGICTIFNISEKELAGYIVSMLDEEIEGCQYSIDSFIIAEYDDEYAGAFAGWIEMENEDEQSSEFLKSNLMGYVFPKKNLLIAKEREAIIKGLNIKREAHTHQLEYAFVEEKYRGYGLVKKLIDEQLKKAIRTNPNIRRSQVPVFGNNEPAIKAYIKAGYKIIKEYKSEHKDILSYLPDSRIILMEKKII